MEIANDQQSIVKAGWLLALCTCLGTGLLVFVNWHSQPYILENERQVLLNTLNSIVPHELYDNDIVQDTLTIADEEYLGSKQPSTIYIARKNGVPAAAVVSVVAPNGYSGPIELLVGINYQGSITGVRVVKHKETPGLGDGIEAQRSDWIDAFVAKNLNNPPTAGWQVKRDGGQFDQFTGATITPRAVVAAVHNSLRFFEKKKDQLFMLPQNSEARRSVP